MNKAKRQSVSAIALLLVFALTAALSLLSLSFTAKASSDPGDPPPENPPNLYENVTYITNHYEYTFADAYGITDVMQFNFPDLGRDFVNNERNICRLEGKLIVFDFKTHLSNGNEITYIVSDDQIRLWLTHMYYVCRTLKNNGCYIVFIYDEDECVLEKYYRETKFLEEVDVHINTDIVSCFINTALIRVRDLLVAENGTYDNCIIVVDDVIEYYLNLYDYTGVSLALKFGNVDTCLVVPDTSTTLNYNEKKYSYNQAIAEFTNSNTYVCSISSLYGGDSLLQWYDAICALNIDDSQKHMFIYTETNYMDFDNPRDIGNNIINGNFEQYTNQVITDVITDLLSGNDISFYDNYPGVCDVTHKAMPAGIGGWLLFDTEISPISGISVSELSEEYVQVD